MKIFNILKKMTGIEDQVTAAKSFTNNSCNVDIKISDSEFKVLAKEYYIGYTSYRAFLKYVFLNNPRTTLEVMSKAQEKAQTGCHIDTTIIKFYCNSQNFIEIPFDVYSNKGDMTISLRNTKSWNRNNLLRILKIYPDFTQYDDSLISEKKIISEFNI